MSRYLKATSIFWSASLAAEMEYRANFVLAALGSAMTLAGAIFSLSLFYQHGYEMGGWSWMQALTVMAVYTILDGFQSTFLVPNRTRVTEHVREGTLDFVLLKPIDSQYWLSARKIAIWGLPNMALGAGLLIYVAASDDAPIGAVNLLAGVVPIALGMIVLYSLGYMLSTLTIWFVKLYNITIAMQALLEAGRFPIAAYPAAHRAFFTFVIPVAFMTTVPAQAILGTATPRGLLAAVAVAFGLLLASRAFWRFALRYYTSASS